MLEAFFRKLEQRDVLNSDERAVLTAAFDPVPKSYPAGSDLVTEGSRPSSSTLVLSGFTTRYRLLEDGKRQITAVHVPGDFVDLPSFLLKVMDHAVGALSPVTVATVPHANLRRITEGYPHLGRMLWFMTLLDSSILREWVVGMGRRTAPEHLAHFICEMVVRLRIAGLADLSFDLPLTQMELGDALGLSAVHINRTLQELRSEHLFTWEGQRIEVLDWDRLKSRARFDPLYLHLEREPR